MIQKWETAILGEKNYKLWEVRELTCVGLWLKILGGILSRVRNTLYSVGGR